VAESELTDVTAKVVIYEAFVEGKLEAPKHLARTVHECPLMGILPRGNRISCKIKGHPIFALGCDCLHR
jgi:hypothetical protein